MITKSCHNGPCFKDKVQPYKENKRFDWIRAYQVGSRSLIWGCQSYRVSAMDFEGNNKEGIAIDWLSFQMAIFYFPWN